MKTRRPEIWKHTTYADSISRLSSAYFQFLNAIPWSDAIIVAGAREGLNKFPSNAWLAMIRGRKYHSAHFVSPRALAVLQGKSDGTLAYEHMVPKNKHIQQPLESLAQRGQLREQDVRKVLEKYWFVATVLEEENMRITPRISMPSDWNGESIDDRYRLGRVRLIVNPLFPFAEEVTRLAAVRGVVRKD